MNIPSSLPAFVQVVEVGPRDGLQNEPQPVPLDVKVQLVDRLSAAGFGHIEAAAFVSPKWVPQMAGSAEVLARIRRRAGTVYSALVPNLKGMDAALAAGVDEVVVFSAASEAFAQKNINCSIAESIERFRPVAQAAKAAGVKLRGSISVALGCPYQGEVRPAAVAEVAQRMADLGCDSLDIADTIGVGTPRAVQAVFAATSRVFPLARQAGHFHDTYGQALANVYAALQLGVTSFHSSVAGLGGCPYAKGASGNVASEDLLYLLHGLGIETGVDLHAVVQAGDFISRAIGRPNNSRAGRELLAKWAAEAAA
jgi:hydroxymethylglutaryl-CoA lyase